MGHDAVIERTILDKDCRVGHDVRLVNRRAVTDEEGPNYVIRDGIIAVTRGTVIPNGTVI